MDSTAVPEDMTAHEERAKEDHYREVAARLRPWPILSRWRAFAATCNGWQRSTTR